MACPMCKKGGLHSVDLPHEYRTLSFRGTREDKVGNKTAYFVGRQSQYRGCKRRQTCMHNPQSADETNGRGRQVSFQMQHNRKPTYTDWMKHRVDKCYKHL